MVNGRSTHETSGFFRTLFDTEFSNLLTRRAVKILYALITFVYTCSALGLFVDLLVVHTATDLLVALVAVPLAYLAYLIVARVALEVVLMVYGIATDLRALRDVLAPELLDTSK